MISPNTEQREAEVMAIIREVCRRNGVKWHSLASEIHDDGNLHGIAGFDLQWRIRRQNSLATILVGAATGTWIGGLTLILCGDLKFPVSLVYAAQLAAAIALKALTLEARPISPRQLEAQIDDALERAGFIVQRHGGNVRIYHQ